MRIIFAGTPEFARVALARLHDAGFEIALVLTQPDRPAGRGMKLQASAVKQWAQSQPVPVTLAQPRSLRLEGKYPEDAAAARAAIAAAHADVMVVAAYGLILPQWVLDAPRLGCMNIHASLLPRWRGAAPIHRAIEAGDLQTGITVMQMDAGLDTGAMLLAETLAIEATDTTAMLHDRLAALGGKMIVQALQLAGAGALVATPQLENGVSYARKIDKLEALIDWRQPASVIERKVRAFNPAPGAVTTLDGSPLKIFCSLIDSCSRPSDKDEGTILLANKTGIAVQCGDGVLRITELQRTGGKRLPAADFLRGTALVAGTVLGLSSIAPEK